MTAPSLAARPPAAKPLAAPVVYGIVLSVLMVCAPHVEHLPLWVSALCAVTLLWRALVARRNLALPRRWLLLGITFGGIIGLIIEFHTLFGQEAGVTLLVMLTAFKLLEMRSARDATLVIYLASFIIITNFFYSQTILTTLYMVATLLVIVTAWLHLQSAGIGLKPRLRIAGQMLAQSIPLMLVLFLLFPRVQGPLWGMPHDDLARTGLTDTMSPGSISRLSRSDDIAFRVTFKGKPPMREQMYWRGPVLSAYDGESWTAGKGQTGRVPSIADSASFVDYSVMLEPHYKRWLFAMELPVHISIPARMSYDFQLLQREPVSSREQYDVRSALSYRVNVQEDRFLLRYTEQLPPNINPRARELAASWRAKYGSDEAVMLAALRYFNQEKFTYTLEPPLLTGANTVDEFLFTTRQGFCEHYAGAFVFLMRAAGIPARVVTGYQGGEFNALGDYFIVRQSDAHAWAEIWLKDRGWVRVDPTAAVSPARIRDGLAAAVPNAAELPLMQRTSSAWLLRIKFNLDLVAYKWNLWVLGYDSMRQLALLNKLGMADVTWRKLAAWMVGLMGILTGAFALFMLRHLYGQRTDAAQRLYLRFCRKLEKAGVRRAAHEGPGDFAARAASLLPQHAAAISDITARYVALRYEPGQPAEALNALRRTIAAFKL